MPASNKHLQQAKENRQDEYYTRMKDVELELNKYRECFRDKVIYCNCNNPYLSNFFRYFLVNFNDLGIKKLIATCFESEKNDNSALKATITCVPDNISVDGKADLDRIFQTVSGNSLERLHSNGDYRSEECQEILKESDIVITNPPFSLLRKFLVSLIEGEKQFIILGNYTAMNRREVFEAIRDCDIWVDDRRHVHFEVPDHYENRTRMPKDAEPGKNYIEQNNICWFVRLPKEYRPQHELHITREYEADNYIKFENYNAINVDYLRDIPKDYYGNMGVPVTFLLQYNPEQFDVLGMRVGDDGKDLYLIKEDGTTRTPFNRVLIRRRRKS